mgnify:CR=1 FL=1
MTTITRQPYNGLGEIEDADLTILSLGAGVQSSVLALMAAKGLITKPDAAIFADTQWEPQGVYDHLDWLENEVKHAFPVYRVNIGDIRARSLETTTEDKWRPSIPVFIDTPIDNVSDKAGAMAPRQCTAQYKILPIQKKTRELLGLNPRQRMPKGTIVENMQGISLDEIYRMKASRISWMPSRYPLIEMKMSRWDCQVWFEKNYPGQPLQKSACIGCPYKNDRDWKNMKENDPVSWADLVDFDHSLRNGNRNAFGAKFPVYVHRSMKPIDEIDFSDDDSGQLDLFSAEECEGMCGV